MPIDLRFVRFTFSLNHTQQQLSSKNTELLTDDKEIHGDSTTLCDGH